MCFVDPTVFATTALALQSLAGRYSSPGATGTGLGSVASLRSLMSKVTTLSNLTSASVLRDGISNFKNLLSGYRTCALVHLSHVVLPVCPG